MLLVNVKSYLDLTRENSTWIERIYKKNKNLGLKTRLHDYLVEIYFALELSWFKDSKDLKDLITLMKEIVIQIVRNYPKDTKIDTYVSDDETDDNTI
jgi:hypothetical protein